MTITIVDECIKSLDARLKDIEQRKKEAGTLEKKVMLDKIRKETFAFRSYIMMNQFEIEDKIKFAVSGEK